MIWLFLIFIIGENTVQHIFLLRVKKILRYLKLYIIIDAMNPLKKYLLDRDITLHSFSKTIERSVATVWKICNGSWPSRDTAKRIKEATNGEVTPNDLLEE